MQENKINTDFESLEFLETSDSQRIEFFLIYK